MLVGIGFIAVLTATIASQFVKNDQQSDTGESVDALARIEVELADLRARFESA